MNHKLLKYLKVGLIVASINAICLFAVIFFNQKAENMYSLELIQKDDSWCYQIFQNDQLFIRQEYIPAVSGNQSFKSYFDAKKIGELVVQKLNENKFPSVTLEELRLNNVKFTKLNLD